MNILNDIIKIKRKEIISRKDMIPAQMYERNPAFHLMRASFADSLRSSFPAIIAEFKRKSPSKGIINSSADLYQTITGYSESGVNAISVLTDSNFFGGSLTDLQDASFLTPLPLLRKDFIIDAYQIIEAKVYGASAILLIASVLTKDEVKKLAAFAIGLGLDILFEIHKEEDMDKFCPEIKIVGVNNRDLQSFRVNPDNSIKLLEKIPAGCIKVAESGIQDTATISRLYQSGFQVFLIGETFMKTEKPWLTAKTYVNECRTFTVS
jgi:indole-3-glycerol phosphate synthase